jgi:hypothetical protein
MTSAMSAFGDKADTGLCSRQRGERHPASGAVQCCTMRNSYSPSQS